MHQRMPSCRRVKRSKRKPKRSAKEACSATFSGARKSENVKPLICTNKRLTAIKLPMLEHRLSSAWWAALSVNLNLSLKAVITMKLRKLSRALTLRLTISTYALLLISMRLRVVSWTLQIWRRMLRRRRKRTLIMNWLLNSTSRLRTTTAWITRRVKQTRWWSSGPTLRSYWFQTRHPTSQRLSRPTRRSAWSNSIKASRRRSQRIISSRLACVSWRMLTWLAANKQCQTTRLRIHPSKTIQSTNWLSSSFRHAKIETETSSKSLSINTLNSVPWTKFKRSSSLEPNSTTVPSKKLPTIKLWSLTSWMDQLMDPLLMDLAPRPQNNKRKNTTWREV